MKSLIHFIVADDQVHLDFEYIVLFTMFYALSPFMWSSVRNSAAYAWSSVRHSWIVKFLTLIKWGRRF
jgi:hypothetical protein